MVRMRYQYPPTAPSTTPQRFPLGTRVAQPLEGRTGQIEHYDETTARYRLVFNDGHAEDVGDSDVDQFVIRQARETGSGGTGDTTTADEVDIDPQQLLGRMVSMTTTSYNGRATVISGSVASFFPDVGQYRIAWDSGLVEDVSMERAKELAGAAKRKRDDSNVDAPKEPDNKRSRSTDPPLSGQRFPSRSAAYAIIRKVLRAILAQDVVKTYRTEKQMTILKNDDIKPKRALEGFVEADGLKLLQRILVTWMKTTETHDGAMLVMKILAALPGVTAQAVLSSQIGKTLRGIARVSRDMQHVDAAIGDLAEWVIATWRRDVVSRTLSVTVKNLAVQQALEKNSVLPALFVAPLSSQRKLKERQAMTRHLRQLLTAPPVPPKPVAEETEIFLVNYNSLGSVDKRRPIRQVIHIESLVERVRKKNEGGLKDGKEEEDTEVVTPGRIRFRVREEILEYNHNVAPANLMATARSKIFARQRTNSHEDEDGGHQDANERSPPKLPPPNKLSAPVKSILKRREEEEILPANKVVWM